MGLRDSISLYSIGGSMLGTLPSVLLIAGRQFGPLPNSTAVGAAGAVLFMIGPVVGFVAGLRYQRQRWRSAGEPLGLTPESDAGGLFAGDPPLTGTVDGRPVRVEKRWRRSRSTADGSDNTSQSPYTYIETPIDPPAEEGVEVYPSGSDDSNRVLEALEDSQTATVVRDRDVAAVGANDMYAQALVTGRARRTFEEADGIGKVRVGDPSAAFEDFGTHFSSEVPGFAQSMVTEAYEEYGSGDPEVAANVGNRDVLYDSDDLRRQAEAVVAAADAFEEARESAQQYS